MSQLPRWTRNTDVVRDWAVKAARDAPAKCFFRMPFLSLARNPPSLPRIGGLSALPDDFLKAPYHETQSSLQSSLRSKP
jgi:hypothetical protein